MRTLSFPRQIFFLLLAIFLAAISAGAGLAQEPIPSDDDVNAIAKGLYCPVCENVPLDVCPTQACTQWRQVIRDKLAEGWDETQIKSYFVQQYGDRVLAEPPRRGLNWLIYVIPPLALLAGAFVVYRAFDVWRAPVPKTPPVSHDTEDEYIQRLEEELRRR